MREEKRWLSHGNGLSHFSFGCKTFKSPGAKAKQNAHQPTQDAVQQSRKYP